MFYINYKYSGYNEIIFEHDEFERSIIRVEAYNVLKSVTFWSEHGIANLRDYLNVSRKFSWGIYLKGNVDDFADISQYAALHAA